MSTNRRIWQTSHSPQLSPTRRYQHHCFPVGETNGSCDVARWNGLQVAKVVACKHIPHREALAKKINKSAATVRRSFNEEWEGEATGPILVAICRTPNVPFRKLLRDPRYH